jgi:hypothetical protein
VCKICSILKGIDMKKMLKKLFKEVECNYDMIDYLYRRILNEFESNKTNYMVFPFYTIKFMAEQRAGKECVIPKKVLQILVERLRTAKYVIAIGCDSLYISK